MAATTSQQLLEHQWQMGLLLALLPVLLLSVSSYLLLTSRSRNGTNGKNKVLRLPPGPTQFPALGNLHQLGSLPHRNLRSLSRRHGAVMLLRLGTVPAVVVSSAAAARELLREHDAGCCSRPVSPGSTRLSYGLKDVAFAPHGEYWRHARRLLVAELLSSRRVAAAWRAREKQADKLVAELTSSEGMAVAMEEHVFGFADGVIGAVAFGNIYGTDWFGERPGEEDRRSFHQVVGEGMDMVASFSAEDFFPNAGGRLVDRLTGLAARRDRVFRDLDAFCEMVIEHHTAADNGGGGGGDLVDALLSLCDNEQDDGGGELRFTREHVKAVIVDAFLAGIDTVAATLLWAMTELMRHPEARRKATAEVRSAAAIIAGKPLLDPDDVAGKQNLPYLRAVVKETLRLHPPSTLMPRETVRDVTVGGYHVPARTRVFVNLWAIGRDPATWGVSPAAPPEEFCPERFDGSDVDYGGAHFELIPFGAGRRICPGLAMGEANVMFALANLLYCFDWALPEGVEPEDVSVEETGVLTFKPKKPLLVVPTRRYPAVPAAADDGDHH